MSVKQAVKVQPRRWEREKKKRFKKTAFGYCLNFVFGLLFSMAGFGNEFSPFGVAFASSTEKEYTISASLGSAVGWFIVLDSVSALRYTSAVLAVCVILSALKAFPKFRDNVLTPAIATSVCLFVTGIAIVFAQNVTAVSVLICFCEGVIGAAATFVFVKCRELLSVKGAFSMLTSKDATAFAVSGMLLLLSVRNISIFGIYPAHILIQLLIMICAFYAKEAGGAIVGVCGGITASLGGGDMFLLGFYSLGGLLSGMFSRFGRIASFLAFAFSGAAVAVISYESFGDLAVVVETVVSGVLFIVLSKYFNSKFEEVLKPSVVSPVIDTVKGDIFRKLKNASEISSEICFSMTSANEAFSRSERGDIKNIAGKTRERVCGSCGLYDVCWKEHLPQTQDTFNTLLNMKKEGVYLEYKTVPQHFSAICIRTENVASSFNKLYGEYKLHQKNESRFKEMHNLAAMQFVNVSALLDSLRKKLDDDIRFDIDSATRIKAAASGCGFSPIECCCIINTLEKMTVELKVENSGEKTELASLGTQTELITSRKFELPIVEKSGEFTRIMYKEKADLKIITSGMQYCADGEKYSGDTFSTFEDENGFFYAMICDGMGTGTKAALTSSLAVTLLEKMIKAGFGITAAVNTVNTSLITKSGDESSVTLDLVVIDRFTGHTEFYKCGAVDTIVKKGSRILDVGFSSLPLGIISDTEASCGTGTLGKGDVLVMTSDGVRDEDKPFLKKKLKSFGGGEVRMFTNTVAENIRNSQGGKKDDLTVLTIAVTDNE